MLLSSYELTVTTKVYYQNLDQAALNSELETTEVEVIATALVVAEAQPAKLSQWCHGRSSNLRHNVKSLQ